jgi:hypothetical protein
MMGLSNRFGPFSEIHMANKEQYTREEFEAALEAERAKVEAERAKLTGKLTENDERTKQMQEELKALTKFRTDAEKAEAKRQEEIEKARQAAENEKLTAQELIAKQQQEWQTQLAQVQQQQATERELMARELKFMQLKSYTQTRINEESENIAPEFLDYIDGDTEEAIEASIEKAKAKTASLLEGLSARDRAARAGMLGVSPGGAGTPISPLDAPGQVNLNDVDWGKMSNAEYAKMRSQLGIGGQGQGLFG